MCTTDAACQREKSQPTGKRDSGVGGLGDLDGRDLGGLVRVLLDDLLGLPEPRTERQRLDLRRGSQFKNNYLAEI